ncbi:MAG: bifunctional hydroxymethylpyrimidine kinase/phosphomethylpyrimidine kinase [Candidatus Krumholzibacteriia bacterium]
MAPTGYRRCLTVAGSDSGGGAGIQADLKTFAALGCYGMSVITALTAQNTTGVTAIHSVPPEFVAQQMDAVLTDIGADAVKVGMLQSPEIVRAVAERLRAHGAGPVVVDPVMVAKSGDELLRAEAVAALREELIPLAAVLTPNLPETAVLLDVDARDLAATGRAGQEDAGRRLLALGSTAVLVKGGHAGGDDSDDCLCWLPGHRGRVDQPEATTEGGPGRHPDDGRTGRTDGPTEPGVRWFTARRVVTGNTHGTGCTLSSAIAAHLARGYDIIAAVERAKRYLTGAILAGASRSLGHGHAPVHHFFDLWRDGES